MPLDNSKLKKVYATLQQGGYQQDYNTFLKGFTGNDHYENRKKVYDLLSANGAQIGDTYEDFMKKMWVSSAPAKPAAPTTPAKETPTTPTPTNAEGTPLTEADRQKMLGNVDNMMAQSKAGLQRAKNRMDYAKANTGLRTPSVSLGVKGGGVHLGQNSKVVETKPQYNAESGKVERSYITESGNEYEERGGADLEQNAIDEARFQSEQQEAYLLREKQRIEQEMNQRGRELDAEAVDFSWRDMPRGSGGAIHTYNSTTVNGRFADTKYKSLLAQLNKVNDGLATLAEAKKGKASDQWIDDSSNWASKKGKQLLAFGAGAWRGLAHAVGKVSTWDMGMTDMATNGALYTAAVDADKKGIDSISREDRDLLDITAYTNAIQSENGQYLGRGYKAGQVTGESLPFMIEMMLNPASKLGTTATNKLMREAVKRYGKEAVKKATKKYLAAKIGTRLMGDAVGSMAMAGTTGQGHVTADMLNRLTGDVQFKVDDSGKIVYGGREGAEDSVLKAYLKAFGAQTIENHSEMVGEYFAPFLGKAASLTRKGMNKIGLGKVNKLIDDIGATNAAKMIGDFEKQTKWNGTIGEYAEEVVGNIENAMLVGDNTLDTAEGTGVFNWDQNVDTFLGVSLMGGFFAGAKTLSYRGPKRQALNEMSDAGKVIDNAIGDNVPIMEKWGGWRNTFLVGTDEEKKAALREVMDNTDLPIKFRMGVLNFVKAAQKYEGIVRAQESKVKEGEQDPVAQSSDESYDNGYDTTEPEAMNDAKNMYDYKRQQMSDIVTDEFLADFDNDPVGTLSQVMGRDDFSEDEKQLALDYVNAKATYDGMIDRVRDDIDSRIEESNATVNSRMNRNDGMIHPATLKLDDRKVYIVDGTINMQDDGSMVDVSNSSESILVRDAETGKLEFMSPSDVLTTDEAIDPAAEKEAAQQALREQYAQEQSDRIDGVLAFNVGDTYDLTDGSGQQWSAQIVADNGDGTVQVAWNGDPNSISTARKDELQSMRDNHNLARLNEYEQQRAAQRQEQQAEAAEPQRHTYNLNDEITLRDEEGNPVRGSITAEENEDGEIEVYTEQPINGKQVQLLRRDELDNMLLEQNGEVVENVPSEETPSVINLTDDESEDNAEIPVTAEEGAEGATLEPASATSEEQHTEEEPHTEPMPMIGEGEDAEPDFASVTPQRAHEYIFNESGLDEEDAKDFMTNNLRAAETAVTKIKNKKPKMGTSIAKFNKDKAEWQQKLDEANANLDYWQQVKAERNAVLAERAKAQQEADKKQTEEAQAAEAAYREEMAKKEAEQAALGTNTVSPAIRDKWNAAPKVEGAQNEIVLANGEKVAGRYYLVESGAATPSHNSANGFVKSEGFPVDENGGSVNDRDYERDKDAQQITRDIANKYDSRAMQTPVVVSQDGVVLSGNGRTMAGELAAAQGTDAEYNEHLAKYPTQYGFTSEQVKGMQHPRVVFVPDAAMPYTADTFAKFNQQEMKGQSKTEHSVKLGKVVDDETFNRIISLINRFDTLGDFYADFAASREAIGELSKCGAISRPQMAEMVDGDGLSAIGKETLENMLIGKAFESNPDAVREATEFKQMRQTIIQALAEISNNISLGKDYSLESELAEAIDLVYNARKSGFKAGDRVSSYARQQQFDFYGVPSTVADYKNATMLLIADILNDNRSTLLKKYLQLYNTNAKDAANGQLDIFSGTVASKESILNDVNELLNYGTEEEQKKAAQEAVEKRKAESVAEAGVVDNGSEGSNEDNDRVEETPAEQAPTNEEGSTHAMSHDEKMVFMRQFLEDIAGDMRLLDVVTDEEVQKLIDLYDAWEVVNDGLGAAHDANDALLNDKNKAIAQKAKENIETAENAANAAFAPVEDYYNELLNTHNIEDEEGDVAETEAPSAETPLSDAISAAEAETDQNPTDGQKEAGNYKKGHVQVGTFDITIENPKGSVRRGKDANGKEWESKMNNTYGYFRGTEGVDGDHIDVFISNDIDGWDGRKVFVVDQYNPDGSFDEHKVMLGFNDADEAKSDYLANYENGWENGRRIDVSAVNLEDFEKWIASSKRKTKPFSEYSSVKKETVGNSFDGFVRDSGGEVIPNGVTRSNVINFAERVLEKYPSHTESYGTYNAQRTDVEIPADKLFKSESDWFTAKNGNSIAVNDTQAKVCYELVAHKDAQGHLKSVSVIKYHSFDNALTDEEVVAITDAMKANAMVAPTVEINDANWKESVETPVGSVKMGENQKAKLFAKGREQQYGMLLETLSNPDVVLEEKDKEQNMFHERPSSYLFVKTFQKEDGSKYVHFESVTVSQEGMEVSISSHIIRENQLKNKLKSDRLLYKATALDAPANTSAEQPIVGGSLSSDGKDTEKDSSDKENGEKSVPSDLEREYQKALEHEADVEQKWEDKILDYVAEHYPTQATVSAATTSVKGVQEREAMKSDPVLRAMRKKADAEYKEALDATFTAQKKMETAKDKMAKVRLQKDEGYSEFAEKHGVSADDVRRYAEGMALGNLALANQAIAEIRRSKRIEHRGTKLSEFAKLFAPLKNELYERFGDMGELQQELERRAEEERNIMEAARRKAAEEERKRLAHLEELSSLDDAAVDERYMDALQKGDEAAAREMLDEAARRKGYGDTTSDYQGVGAWSAPSDPGYESDAARRADVESNAPDVNLEDIALGYNLQPDDYFIHPERYSQNTPHGLESTRAIQSALEALKRGEKDVKVKVYRAVPTSVKEGKLRNGDWVTPSKKYAEMHGNNRLEGKYRIIEDEVPVSELWWDGNDANEWGYDNGKGYKYKNVKNNRKSDALVTRDDKGDIILPSKRFNQRKADERYQRGVDGVKPSKAEVALRDAVIDRLRENGMEVITDVSEGQRVLDEANGRVREMSFGDPYDYEAYPLGRVEQNLADREVMVVKAEANHGFMNYKEAKEWAKKNVSKVYNNEETGGKGAVRISNAAIDKFMSQSAVDKSDGKDVHMSVLKVLPEVLRNSIDVETHPDFLKGKDGKRSAENGMNKDVLVHRCYGAVEIDGTPYRVKITLKEDPRDVSFPHVTHSYEATKIELLAGTWENHEGPSPNTNNSIPKELLAGTLVKPKGDNPNTNNSISAAKLLENVEMSYSPGEKVLDASKKRSADLREQRVGGADGMRFFRTVNGEAYGFTVGGKIYVDPRIATSETPVHEYAHLWSSALRSGNKEEWQNVVELMKGTKVWDEVKNRYPELKTDDEIADEVIATYSGQRGAERLREEQRKIAEGNGGVFEKAEAISGLESVKRALKMFWKGVADFLHIHYKSAEEVADRVMRDLLEGVDPRKMGKGKDGVRYQFIGENGAASADHAEEVSVRLDNLSVAREMESSDRDAKAIKLATGWERGADGKWRYEIADMKEFDRNGNLLYRKNHPDYARYMELLDKEDASLFEDGEALTDEERAEFEKLSKKYESDKFGGEKLDNIHRLEAYVDAPELFKAYPELKGVGFRFEDTGGNEMASYHPISSVLDFDGEDIGEIVVNTGKVSVHTPVKELKSVVLHEMQHAIQEIEGFAMGGNPGQMERDFNAAKAEWAARAYAHELSEKAKELGEEYDQLGVERALIKEYEDMDMQDWLPDKDTRIKGFNYYARGYADRSLDDAIKRFRLDEAVRADFNPYLEYQKLGGEVEARNVQKRMGMSAEERRSSLAAETEDVAREDQLFLYGRGASKPSYASLSHSTPLGESENPKYSSQEVSEDDNLYRIVDDEETIKRLDAEPKITAYRAMQVIDGKLYSPMAAKVDGELTASNPHGAWTEAEETLLDFTQEQKAAMELLDKSDKPGTVELIKGKLRYNKQSKKGKGSLQFHLVKGDGSSLWAAYNPYIHSSMSMLNDQFTSAYKRPNIVVVEVEIPKSELTSGYRAENAKDTVGMTEWKAGPVAGQLPSDMSRQVMLSRWSKVKRIVPYREVADHVAATLNAAEVKTGQKVQLPIESFHPELRKELEKRGFVFQPGKYTEKTAKRKAWDELTDEEKQEAYKGASYMDDAAIEALNSTYTGEWLKRDGDGEVTDSEISLVNDPMSKMLGKSRYSTRQRKEFALRERVKELSEKLNLKDVDIVTDASTLSGDRRRAKGFYNKRTGRITIVVANHSSMSDIEQTLLHEAVAHYGLRELFGEQLDAFLDNVYQHAEPEIRSRITEMARLHGWDFRKATEEYLAGLAETTDFEGMLKGKGFYGWWSFVKRAFLDMLHKIGFGNYDGPQLSDNELRYILWRSYENLKEPGRYRSILGEAEDISKQMDLKVGNFAETDNSAASVADGDSYMYRDGRGIVEHVPDAVVNRMYEEQVKDTRNRTMLGAMTGWLSKDGRKRWKNKFAESYFDYTRSVKALQDAISEATGSKVEKNEDVWKSLNAKSSIDEREVDTMTRMLAVPLGNLISEMVKKSDGKYSLDDIEAYLNAKHGVEERNPYMLNQAVKKSLDMVRKDERLKALSEGYSSDEADAIAEQAVEDARSETMESARRDYSGLTGLFDPAHEGKSIDELEDMARDYVSEIEDYFGKDVTDELWKRVNALNAYSLRKSYECGLLSKKQYDEVSSMYKYYVPLRGWHDGYAGDVYNYVTRGGDRSMIENALKKAYGRTSRAGNILGTMTAMANSAIVMGNKNKVAQTFMNLALNHDETGMFTISEAWYEKNASDDSYRLVTPKLSEDMSAEEVADAIATWEDEMQAKAAAGEAVVRSGKFTKDFQYNLEEWKEQQHCVRVLRNGKEYMVYINGNPRATQAINGLLTPDYSSGVADDFIRKYMRYKAQVQTSLSPKFMISNLQRDAATAVGGSYAKFGAGYAVDVVKNLAGNISDIFRLFHKDRTGTLDMNVDKERWFKEFVEHGGMTGVSSIRKKEEYEAQYAKSVERAVNPKRSAPAKGWESLMDNIEFVNRCVENLTRFSVYMASRKAGKSVKDSVFDAKECSVNFNMKGSGAWGNATLRKYIMYANPALQSLRMISTWYDANKPRTIALLSSGVALGFLNALILSALCGGGGGDDDDNAYYALSDYNRHNYFNVGIGNRKFLHWRLPQEMVPLYALGQIAYDRMSGRISNEQALHQTLVQLNNLSPMAFVESELNYDMSANNTYAKTFVKAVTPDVLSDISDAYLWQEDFLGRRIGNRSEWNTHAPEWQRVDKRTPDFFVKGFEWLDKATGGTDHKRGGVSQVLNPSAVWYILEQQGGGLSQVAHEFYNAGLALMGGDGSEDLEAKDYPFVGKFMVDGGTDAARMRVKNEKFWMYRMEYEAKDAEIKSISRDPNLSFDEKAARISELADDKYLTMYSAVRGWKKLRKTKSLAETDGNKEEEQTAEDNMKMLVDRTVRQIEKPSTIDWDDWEMDDIVDEVTVDDILDKIPEE